MKAKLVLLVLLVVMAGSFTTAAVALATSGDDKDDRASHGRPPGTAPGTGHAKDRDDRPGPPPWAHGRWDRDGKHPWKDAWKDARKDDREDAWKDAWRELTPAQRAARMAELAEQHADGMKKWAACVQEAGEDRQARRACERPWPPGLAKKMQRP